MYLFRRLRCGLKPLPVLAISILALGAGFVYGSPSFDGGTGVEFNAEDNATVAYDTNPAKLVYYESSAVWFDIGGDWSLGTLKYSENGGKVSPGTPPGSGESAGELTINTAVGGNVFAAFRSGSTVVGIGGGLDWDKVSLGFSGMSVPGLGYFWEGEVFSFSIPTEHIGGVVGFDMKPWAWGFSGEYTLASHNAQVEEDDVYSADLGYTNAELLAGTFYRAGGTHFDAAGGVQILKNRLEMTEPYSPMTGGEASAMRIMAHAGYRTPLWAKCAFGVNGDVKMAPAVTVTDDDLDYDIAEGNELDLAVRPGFALYPDEQTTLAFDYNVVLRRINLDTLAENGDVLGEHSLSETWTNTQVGLERWFTEDIAAKAGWRQNILAYPRNTLFAGACYRPNERWTFNYDYAEGTIAVDKISAFMTLADVINPGGHRITLTYNF